MAGKVAQKVEDFAEFCVVVHSSLLSFVILFLFVLGVGQLNLNLLQLLLNFVHNVLITQVVMELFLLERESILFVLFLKLELLLPPPLSVSVENSVKLFSLSPSDDF